ncbi:MAG: hypothetical protein MJ082_04980 [Clostridia bacterium]|nr:hypothetical protein [Clostridia bacterium]
MKTLKMIATILVLPFVNKDDVVYAQVNQIKSKPIRVTIKLLILLLPLIFFLAVVALISFLLREYVN